MCVHMSYAMYYEAERCFRNYHVFQQQSWYEFIHLVYVLWIFFPLCRIWVLTSSRLVPLQTILTAKQCPLVLVHSQRELTWRDT